MGDLPNSPGSLLALATVISAHVQTYPAYDPVRGFAAIALPGQLNYASAGAGSGAYLFMELTGLKRLPKSGTIKNFLRQGLIFTE